MTEPNRLKACGHLLTIWCACTKHHDPGTPSVLWEVTKIGGIPIPPVRFRAPANATTAELERLATNALCEG